MTPLSRSPHRKISRSKRVQLRKIFWAAPWRMPDIHFIEAGGQNGFDVLLYDMRPVSVGFDIFIGTLGKSDAGDTHNGFAGYNDEDVKVGITDSLCGFGRAMDFMATSTQVLADSAVKFSQGQL